MQKSWYRIALAIALGAALGAAPALAAGPEKAGDTKAGDTASPSMSGTTGAGEFSARHTMSGEVTRVDQKKGTLSLKTPEGTLNLHFPPSALSNVKKGDHVSVELALKPEGGGPSASPAGRSDKSGASPKSDSGSRKY